MNIQTNVCFKFKRRESSNCDDGDDSLLDYASSSISSISSASSASSASTTTARTRTITIAGTTQRRRGMHLKLPSMHMYNSYLCLLLLLLISVQVQVQVQGFTIIPNTRIDIRTNNDNTKNSISSNTNNNNIKSQIHPKFTRSIHHNASNKNSSSSSDSSSSDASSDTPESILFQKRSKSWVVIVDDEETIRLSLGNYLYQSGYSVTACADAEALLELLSSISQGGVDGFVMRGDNDGSDGDGDSDGSDSNGDFKSYQDRFPNVIVCDIRMPGEGMDGIDLLTILKNPPLSSTKSSTSSVEPLASSSSSSTTSNLEGDDWDFIRQRWKRIPVVLLTAKSLTQDRIEGYRRGADVYLPKPFSPDELLSIVDNLIARTQVLTGSSARNGRNGDGRRSVSLDDLKGDLLEIKGILREKEKLRGMINGSNGGENRLIRGRSPLPKSSALVPSSKNKRLGQTGRNGKNIPQSEIDAFNEQVKITPTEIEVLNLLSEGCTNAEIAKSRGNSSVTSVSRVISNLYSKTLTKTRTELVKWGLKMGYISAAR